MTEEMLSRNIGTLEEFEEEILKHFDMNKISKNIDIKQEPDEKPTEIYVLYHYDTGRKGWDRFVHIGTFISDFDNIDLYPTIGKNWIFSKEHLERLSDNLVKFKQ